jgi:hypothetical protein
MSEISHLDEDTISEMPQSKLSENVEKLITLSCYASFFEILFCIAEIWYISYEFNYIRIESEKIKWMQIVFPDKCRSNLKKVKKSEDPVKEKEDTCCGLKKH